MAGASECILIARVGAAHGLKGEVRVKAFTEVATHIGAYGTLESDDGRCFEVEGVRPAAGASPDMVIVRFKGIGNRTQAEALNGIELKLPRDRLPEIKEDE